MGVWDLYFSKDLKDFNRINWFNMTLFIQVILNKLIRLKSFKSFEIFFLLESIFSWTACGAIRNIVLPVINICDWVIRCVIRNRLHCTPKPVIRRTQIRTVTWSLSLCPTTNQSRAPETSPPENPNTSWHIEGSSPVLLKIIAFTIGLITNSRPHIILEQVEINLGVHRLSFLKPNDWKDSPINHGSPCHYWNAKKRDRNQSLCIRFSFLRLFRT